MNSQNKSYWDLFAAAQHAEISPAEEDQLRESQQHYPDDFEAAVRIRKGLHGVHTQRQFKSANSWNNIESQIQRQRVRLLSLAILKYAAVILLTVGAFHLFQTQFHAKSGQQYAQVDVLPGQIGHLFLFDGTEVWLNSGSQLKYPSQFNQDNRDVFLVGEGFFKVSKNKELPFKVKTDKLEVEVLGTSFNVSAYKDEARVKVVLEEGQVKLNQTDGRAIGQLVPGQLADLDLGANELSIQNVETEQYTNWKDGIIEFEGETLNDVFRKLERWYNVDIQLEDPIVGSYEITGTVLRNKPVQQIIQAFEFLAPIRTEYYSITDEKDIIKVYKK